jgi:chromosome segregation ATPase
MSTLSNSAPITTDEFQALEQKVLRAVEIVKREREARAAAEAEVAALRAQLEAEQASQAEALSAAQAQLSTLNQERDAVRQRVEKMLQQMDELL